MLIGVAGSEDKKWEAAVLDANELLADGLNMPKSDFRAAASITMSANKVNMNREMILLRNLLCW